MNLAVVIGLIGVGALIGAVGAGIAFMLWLAKSINW